MADDLRVFHRFPGTDIVIYESSLPGPQVVLLAQHYIKPGATRARSAWDPDLKRSVNVVAGEEGEELVEGSGSQSSGQKRRQRVEGLGEDEKPKRRIVGPKTTTTTVQVTTAERVAKQKAAESDADKFLLEREKKRTGTEVRGWRMRVLSPEKEIAIYNESYNTKPMLDVLFKRIPSDQKAWLQSGLLLRGDPYGFMRTSSRQEDMIWTPWVNPGCTGWLVVQGAKIGLYFAARTTPHSVEAKELQKDVEDYLSGTIRCETKAARKPGLMLSSEVLGIEKNMAVTVSPKVLFEKYQEALRSSTDREQVHEAYHRILLHRFFQRRLLVPTAKTQVGRDIERRANALQARRVFAFDSKGCPTRLNKRFLEQNGINMEILAAKNPTLLYKRNPKDIYTVEEWTKWLYEDVLGKDPVECRKILTSESVDGLRALAGLGVLG